MSEAGEQRRRIRRLVERALAAPALAASPSAQELLRWLARETESGRPAGQREVAHALFGDETRTARARGAVRELRRRLRDSPLDEGGTRLVVTEAPWTLRVRAAAEPHGRVPSEATRRPRSWVVVAVAAVLAVLSGAGARFGAGGPSHGPGRSEVARLTAAPGDGPVRALNAWDETLWTRPLSRGRGPDAVEPGAWFAILAPEGGRPGLAVWFSPHGRLRMEQPLNAARADGSLVFQTPLWNLLGNPGDVGLLEDVLLDGLPTSRTGLDVAYLLLTTWSRDAGRSFFALVDLDGERVAGLQLEGLRPRATIVDLDDDRVAELVLGRSVKSGGEDRIVLTVHDLPALLRGEPSSEIARLTVPMPQPVPWDGLDSFCIWALHGRAGWVQAELTVGHQASLWLYFDGDLEPQVQVGDAYAIRHLHEPSLWLGAPVLDRAAHERDVARSIAITRP